MVVLFDAGTQRKNATYGHDFTNPPQQIRSGDLASSPGSVFSFRLTPSSRHTYKAVSPFRRYYQASDYTTPSTTEIQSGFQLLTVLLLV